ncbi:MAG TPA: cbb3-type cytochrome c oxidase subunit I, partial [Balneolaceae bacterium]|nr:cbb3-type cytochrome c oxidase subunit I [Balneolaceae bacterium]
MKIRYQTQKLAYRFFVSMLIIFALQVAFGLLLAVIQMDPDLLKGVLNFNVARAFHLNLGIVWLVTGFIGTILFIGPLLGEREVRPAWLAKFLLIAIWVVVAWTAATLPLAQKGIAGWLWNQPWLQQGKEYLEAGRISDILLLVGFSIFAYLTVHMFPKKMKKWNEMHWGLAIGVSGLAAMWVFSLWFSKNLDVQEYYRWFIVHYWVEGVWECIHISLIGFLLYKFFGADEKEVGLAVFWGVSLVVLTGLLGNAHHYFWIGTPAFWQFWGSLFSALEPLPMVFCIWHVYLDEKHGTKPLENKAAFYFLFGSAIFELVGAGVLGFTQTFAGTNVWEHGTWVTPAHGHMALFGTFGFLVIGAAYEAIRQIKGIGRFKDQLSKLSFGLLFVGMLGMVGSFALGGTKEIYIYRVLGLDWWSHAVRPAMSLSRVLLAIFGVLFTIGVIILIYDLMTLENREIEAEQDRFIQMEAPAQLGAWDKSMSAFEFGTWIAGVWFFGLIVTAGLFSFNLHSVRLGNPTIPYVSAIFGYSGIIIVTSIFAYRFLKAFEQRQKLLQMIQIPQNGNLKTIDLRDKVSSNGTNGSILDAYKKIDYGQAFILIDDQDLM